MTARSPRAAAPPATPTAASRTGVVPIIAVGSGRGGSGKTTVAGSLTAALASTFGRRLALIDADPQGSASTYLGSAPVGDPLAAPPVPMHGFQLYRGGETMYGATDAEWAQQIARAREGVDAVVVDLPPALHTAHAAILGIPAQLLIVVGELEPGSIQPALKLVTLARELGVPLLVVPNQDQKTPEAGATMLAYSGLFAQNLSIRVIPKVPMASRAIARRTPLVLAGKASPASKAVIGLAGDLVAQGVV